MRRFGVLGIATALLVGLASAPAQATLSTWDYAFCGSPLYATMQSYSKAGVTKHYHANQWPYQLLSTWNDTGLTQWQVHRTYTSLQGAVWQYTTNDGGSLDGEKTYTYCRSWN